MTRLNRASGPPCDSGSDSTFDRVYDAPTSGPGAVVAAIEAVLMVAVEPVPAGVLAQLLGLTGREIEVILAELALSYESQGRGFGLHEVGGGWRFHSRPEQVEVVSRFLGRPLSPRMSQAALETLAVVAYEQPISRSDVAAIRGVDSDASVRTLLVRGLIQVVGISDGPGRAELLGTAPAFLELMGLNSLEELPARAPMMDLLTPVEELESGMRARLDRRSERP
jgi:segregation and condensation protein B